MAIEWEETVETKRRVALVVDLKPSEPFDAPDEVRAATIDDLRRACEAVGGYQFHDWEAVHAICDEHGVSRETMGLDAQMMRPALARERVRELVVKLTEKEERYYQACLDALSEHVSPDATADTPRMVRPSSVLAGIRSLQGRLRDARSDLREHDAALEAAEARRSSEVTGLEEQLAEVVAQRDDLRARLERAEAATAEALTILNEMPGDDIASAARHMMDVRMRQSVGREALRYGLATIIDEAFGAQPVMTHEELLSFLESGLRERTRDLAAARARAEKAEAQLSLRVQVGDIVVRNSADATKVEALREHVRTLEADLAAARARIAELEAPMPEAEEYALLKLYDDADGHARAIRAVAERVRRVRPQCLIARAVAANIDVRVAEDQGGGFMVAAHRAGEDEAVVRNVPAAEVPDELARMLTEVGA